MYFSLLKDKSLDHTELSHREYPEPDNHRKWHIICPKMTSQGVYVGSRVFISGPTFSGETASYLHHPLRLLSKNKLYLVICRYFRTILISESLVDQRTWLGTFKIFLSLSATSLYCPQAERTKDISWAGRDINYILDKTALYFLHSQNLREFFESKSLPLTASHNEWYYHINTAWNLVCNENPNKRFWTLALINKICLF